MATDILHLWPSLCKLLLLLLLYLSREKQLVTERNNWWEARGLEWRAASSFWPQLLPALTWLTTACYTISGALLSFFPGVKLQRAIGFKDLIHFHQVVMSDVFTTAEESSKLHASPWGVSSARQAARDVALSFQFLTASLSELRGK